MLPSRHIHMTWELVKWLIVFTLAAALAISIATQMADAQENQPDPSPPALLPLDLLWSASPMSESVSPAFNAHKQDTAMKLWIILEHQHSGRLDKALEGWSEIQLSEETEIWRLVALSQAYIASGQLSDAADVLDRAEAIDDLNPLVRYYTGLLRIDQADRAQRWYDATGIDAARLVVYRPFRVAPNNRSMNQLSAIAELTRAIELAPLVYEGELLVPESWPTQAALAPTVSNLLLALGADNYPGKAHYLLSYLYLDFDSLRQAESHMDRACEMGVSVQFGYRELGERYQQQDLHLDAMRAYAKDATQGHGFTEPLRKAIENLREAFWEEL